MKRVLLFGAVCAMFLLSCSDKGNKFVGKWKPTTFRMFDKDVVLGIEKQGEQFVVGNIAHPDQVALFTYIEKQNMLTGSVSGTNVRIKYIDSTDHLSFEPERFSGPTEFEKADQ